MWEPTHVQVVVQKGVGLLTKGKNNTNDCFVTIALGKTKYQTSVKEKSSSSVEWHEECELPIPDQGNTAEIVLTAFHRSMLGLDDFLGRVYIPLNTLDFYERPKNKWYPLQEKKGKATRAKERGHLEVKIGFKVKSGSLTELNKKEKHKSSIGQLSVVAQSVGGSLLSLGSSGKRKGIKKFAKSIGSKMHLRGKKKDGDLDDGGSSIGSVGSLKTRSFTTFDKFKSKQTKEDADPGVVSEDEDEFTFDDLSHKSSASSLSQPPQTPTLSIQTPPSSTISTEDRSPVANPRRHTTSALFNSPQKPPRNEPPKPAQNEWEWKLAGGNKPRNLLKPTSNESLNRKSWDSTKLSSQIEEEESSETITEVPASPKLTPEINSNGKLSKSPDTVKKEAKESMLTKLKNFRKGANSDTDSAPSVVLNNRISNELLQKFEGKSREDLILSLCDTQHELDKHKKKLKDLEDYLDDLLLRVMETTPVILQNPYGIDTVCTLNN